MFRNLKQQWREFKRNKPGQRFQIRYRKHHDAAHKRTWLGRLLIWTTGLVLLAIGAVLCVIPGPGIPFVFLGGGVIASESLVAARLLDWGEVKFRIVLSWARRIWKRLPLAGKAVIVCASMLISAASAYAGFRLLWS